MKHVVFLFLLIAFHANAQIGKIGINTTAPVALLHVKDSAVVFTGSAIGYGPSYPNTPAIEGVMMMWYPAKGAFRSGFFYALQIEESEIGTGSFASGYSCIASGPNSVAMGNQAVARGGSSVALGISSADGLYSLAANHNTLALGSYSTAFGSLSRATGSYTTVFGQNNRSRSLNCFTIGRYNDSIATSSPMVWADGDPLFIIGNGNSDVSRKNALVVLKDARAGININNPYVKLHVREGISGVASASNNVVAFFENDQSAFLQLASHSAFETGILSASQLSNIRGGIVFTADSSISFKSGGNLTRFQVSKTGELTRPSVNGSANMIPICYGSVAAAGTINSGSNNFSVTNAATGQYDITITGESYLNSNFATTVTVIGGSSFRIATTGSSVGNLIVRIFDINGNQVNTAFHFIIFKP